MNRVQRCVDLGRGDPPTPTPHPAPSIRPPSINTHTDTDTHLLRLGRHLMRLLLQPLPRLAPHSFSVTTIRWAGRVGVNVDAVCAAGLVWIDEEESREGGGCCGLLPLVSSRAVCAINQVCKRVMSLRPSMSTQPTPCFARARQGSKRMPTKRNPGSAIRAMGGGQEGGTRAPQSIPVSCIDAKPPFGSLRRQPRPSCCLAFVQPPILDSVRSDSKAVGLLRPPLCCCVCSAIGA